MGELLIESGDLGSRGELGRGVAGAEAVVEELIANHVGFVLGMRGIGRRLARLGAMHHVVYGDIDLHADGRVVLLETKVVVLMLVYLAKRLYCPESDLRPPEIARLTEGGLSLGTCDGVGRLDGWTGDRGGAARSGEDKEGRNTVAGGAESLRRKTDQAGEMGLIGGGLVFRTQPGEWICAAVRREVVRSMGCPVRRRVDPERC